MDIKDIKLRKGMSREEVNELISEHGKLHDEIYLGNSYKHDWICKCGDIIRSKRWTTIKRNNLIKCDKCKYNETEQRYKYEVEKDGEYEYIRSFRKGDILPNGRVVGDNPYIQVKHKYCESVYEIVANNFINQHQRCGKCCGSYENSFAYYIEKVLGEPIEKYWDFDKNTVNPYHICKNVTKEKVWIKCNKITYHESFEITLANFIKGSKKSTLGCPYCHGKKTHPKDSFAQYHIYNTDSEFLNKYWSDKNTIDPWSISPYSGKKVWIKCQDKDYHNDNGGYEIVCSSFTDGKRCSYCHKRKVHPFDSFGYKYFDKAQSWHSDNNISPFRVSPNGGRKFKFICSDCGYE